MMMSLSYYLLLFIQVDDYNNVMKARIESLKTSQDLSTADIVEQVWMAASLMPSCNNLCCASQHLVAILVFNLQLRSWNGYFEKYHGSLNG